MDKELGKLIELGLQGEAPLKVILKGETVIQNDAKIGVVAVVFATTNKELAESQLTSYLRHATPEQYFMVYSVPLDVKLTTLSHYPSIAISREDLDA